MKKITQLKCYFLVATGTLLVSVIQMQAGSFTTDFNSGLSAGTAIFGNAAITPNDGTGGGFTNSGCLQLTPEAPSQTGVFIITNDFDGGQPVVSFTATFKALVGSIGNGADGFSFNFASDLDLSGAWANFEEGNGTGLTVSFDTYPNGLPDTAQSVDVKIGGTQISSTSFPGLRAGTFVDVLIQLNPDGTLSVAYDGVYAVSNLDVSALGSVTGGGFGFGARCGSVTDSHLIDNLSIVTRTNAAAFVSSFSPRGRRAKSNSAIDVGITNYVTSVNTNSVQLKLDGATVTPMITQDGNGNTAVHYAPSGNFNPLTTHAVSLTFTDNASQTNVFACGFTVIADYTVVFSDDFESRNQGALDMNLSGGPNENANGNLPGNPWFGPAPPNAQVVPTEGGVLPNSGTNMIRGSNPSDLDENWYNISYRQNNGTPFKGNIKMDWWFYDPLGAGGSTYREFAAIGFYNTAPNDTDYPGTGSLNSSSQIQRLSLGASSVTAAGYDSSKYQARVVNAVEGYSSGWFNTPTPRSIGWHHGRIVVGPPLANSAPYVHFYIDDMDNPTFTHNAILVYSGYNVIELNTAYGATRGYMDDVSFAVVTPPKVSAALTVDNVILTWPGLGFTLQSATDVAGPYTDLVGATSPYTNDIISNPMLYFRLRD